MLTVWEAIQSRRSIRKYKPDDVPEEMLNQILEAARLAPSGSNRQPWRFLVVRDAQQRKELRELCLRQTFIEEAPVDIICFVDLHRFSEDSIAKRRQEYIDSGTDKTITGRFADPDFQEYMQSLPPPTREQIIPGAIANTYIAVEHIVLMAAALGLGTCWVGGFDPAGINKLFNLPDNLVPVVVIPLGYPAGEIPPQRPRVSLEEILVDLP